jgi:hypothetical protein
VALRKTKHEFRKHPFFIACPGYILQSIETPAAIRKDAPMFAKLFRRLPAPATSDDPLTHPDVQRMSLRELADLPLPRPCRDRPLATGRTAS